MGLAGVLVSAIYAIRVLATPDDRDLEAGRYMREMSTLRAWTSTLLFLADFFSKETIAEALRNVTDQYPTGRFEAVEFRETEAA